MVPLTSDESNFGVADRGMLTPLKVDDALKFPFQTMLEPAAAAKAFNEHWLAQYGALQAFDLCLLGMGDDGHTASIFPGSELLGSTTNDLFAGVEVPGKGWRLTITKAGFAQCSEIVITVTGARKASVLKDVLEGEDGKYPVQLLREHASKVTWLVDEEAASALKQV
jgi:6-phosphogluconolactonase